MKKVFEHPKSITKVQTKYCAGCGHGVVHRIIGELIDELGFREKTIITNPVGCAIWADLYFNFDSVQPAHGRTPAAATAIKRVLNDSLVICYQGDGDLAAIGTAETVHAANRGEQFTTIFINNAIYGMTGGQMAPTTLVNQKATTAPEGRDPSFPAGMGYPIKILEMLSTLQGTMYLARGATDTAAHIKSLKKYIRTAFLAQLAGYGSTMVEVLSPCPTNWGVSAVEATQIVTKQMIPQYPLGEIKNTLPIKIQPQI